MAGSQIDGIGSGRSLRAMVVLGVVLLFGLESAFLGFRQLRVFEEIKATRRFAALAEERSQALRDEFGAVVSAFEAFASEWQSSEVRSRETFSALALSQVCPLASFATIAWAPRIGDADRALFEQSLQAEKVSPPTIVDRGEGPTATRSGSRPEYYPVRWLERSGAGGGPIAAGTDIASHPRYRETIDTAIARHSLAASTAPPARASTNDRVLLIDALFATVGDPSAAAVEGVVAAELDLHLLVGAALSRLPTAPLSLSILDASAGPVSFYTAGPGVAAGAATIPPALTHRSVLTIAQRQWTIVATAGPGFVAERRTFLPWLALIVIAALTITALALTRALQTRTEQIAEDLRKRAIDLDSTRQALGRVEAMQSAILDSAGTAIIATDMQGIIRIFNKAAETTLGWKAEDVIGKGHPADFFDADELAARAPVAAERLGREITRPFDVCFGYTQPGTPAQWTLVRKDGTRFPALISFSTVEESPGVPVGFLGLGQDITDRVRAEHALANVNAALERRVEERTAELTAANLRLERDDEDLRAQNQTLTVVSNAQRDYLENADWRSAMSRLLGLAMARTSSEFGLIGVTAESGALRVLAHDGVRWKSGADERVYDAAITNEAVHGYFELRNPDTLYGHALRSGEVVLSNDPAADPRSGGVPEGHPSLNSFLGIPLIRGESVIGMIGLANTPAGYDAQSLAAVEPLRGQTAVLCDSYLRAEKESLLRAARDQAEAELLRSYEAAREAERRARSALDAMSAHVCIVERDGRISATNAAWRAFGARCRAASAIVGEGSNYLETCDRAAAAECPEAAEVAMALRDILAGKRTSYECEYSCSTPEEVRWFQCHMRRFAVREAPSPLQAPSRVVVAHNDITGIKLAQLEAEHRRDLLWSFAESSPIAIFVTDHRGRMRQLNPHAEAIFGRELAAEREGRQWLELIHPDDRATTVDAWTRLVERRETVMFHVRVLRPDGSPRWVVVRAAPLQGQIEGEDFAVGTMVDVTERTRIEIGLRLLSTDLAQQRGGEFFRAAARSLAEITRTDAVFIAVRSAGDQSRIHSLALVVDGNPRPDVEAALEGTPCAEVFDSEPRVFADRVQELFPKAAILATLGAESYAGVPLWDSQHRALGTLVALGRKPMTDPDSVVALLRVFSTRIGAEIERASSERSFHDLFEFAPDVMLIVDRGGRIVRANRQVSTMFGYRNEELIGSDVEKLIPDELRERHVALRDEYSRFPVSRSMGTTKAPLYARRRDNTRIPVDVSLSPLETDEGLMIVAAVRDVTVQRAAEAHREHERLAALLRAEVNEALGGSRRLEAALQACATAIVARVDVAVATVWLYDRTGQALTRIACSDPALADAAGALIDPMSLRRVIHDGARLCSASEPDERHGATGLRSLAVFPLTIEATRLGALVVAASTAFSEEEVETLELISGILAANIARRRAEDAVRELAADLERRVAERTVALEAANKELEAFSASVSHDLRAPLRRIGGFASMLREDLGEQLQPATAEHLQVISRSAIEMGHLIDALLAAARASRAEMRLAPVATGALVHEVIESLRPDLDGRSIEWTVDALPDVIGDERLLKQVFANLIGNAVKYTRPRPVARIHVGTAGDENGRTVIFVRDNGAGFDMLHARKLFGMFQRMHSAEEFEGTGIGLANVERIIARHGGRVWAESEPDRGATFYVTLRCAPAA
ncbi:MAG: PAS domain S-box protein [Deltaproteobacteria bacterium]|nr:PAS domain S-box protein [Deltaproteobacteria bacterium]